MTGRAENKKAMRLISEMLFRFNLHGLFALTEFLRGYKKTYTFKVVEQCDRDRFMRLLGN